MRGRGVTLTPAFLPVIAEKIEPTAHICVEHPNRAQGLSSGQQRERGRDASHATCLSVQSVSTTETAVPYTGIAAEAVAAMLITDEIICIVYGITHQGQIARCIGGNR